MTLAILLNTKFGTTDVEYFTDNISNYILEVSPHPQETVLEKIHTFTYKRYCFTVRYYGVYCLQSLRDPDATALSDKLAMAKNKTLVDNNAEAANKVLSGTFAYITDVDSVDQLAASSRGAMGRNNSTLKAPGFSLAAFAVKKG